MQQCTENLQCIVSKKIFFLLTKICGKNNCKTNVWIIQSKQPDKFTAPIKKGLKACLQWKVHLAYPASLQELHSNTKKQLFGLQVRRADHLATLPALIVSTILCCEAKVCNNCKLKLLFFRTAVFSKIFRH